MKFTKMFVGAVSVLAVLFTGNMYASPKEKALVVGSPNYCAKFSQLLKNDFSCTNHSTKNGEKSWHKQGYALPEYKELKQYKLVVICPLANTLAGNQKDVVEYVKNGGSIYFGYNSLESMFQKSKNLGYGICGFDKLTPVHLKPYPKAGVMTHKLSYTKEMNRKRDFEKKMLYSVYAGDLIDAVPLVENPEKKGLALACVARYGKGQVIYFGGEDHGIFMDIMKKCGLCK